MSRKAKIITVIVSIIVLALLAAGVGHLLADRIKLQSETEHFSVYCMDEDVVASEAVASVLETNYAKITSDLQAEPSEKCIVTIYHDLDAFHKAIGYEDAPDWLVGIADGEHSLYMVSPENPGMRHSYDGIMAVAVHEFTHLVINEINRDTPTWLNEGVATYEAAQSDGVAQLMQNSISRGTFPTVSDLENIDGNNGLYQFGYALVDYIVINYGYDKLIEFIKTPDIDSVFGISEDEFSSQWKQYYS